MQMTKEEAEKNAFKHAAELCKEYRGQARKYKKIATIEAIDILLLIIIACIGWLL